jgi:hypothetical protein
MNIYPEPHSPEWFAALEAINPQQAMQSRRIIERAGRSNVCSVCGDDPASDYRIVEPNAPINAVLSLRLCRDCKNIRTMQGEVFEPLS